MFRRVATAGLLTGSEAVVVKASSCCWLQSANLTTEARNELMRHLNKTKEEAKGQALDLEDMAETAKVTQKSVQEATTRHASSVAEEKTLSAKVKTLNATLKAYSSRLKNLQNEARAIQNDTDKVLKLLRDGNTTTTPTGEGGSGSPSVETEDFGFSELKSDEPFDPLSSSKTAAAKESVVEEIYTTKVETVEAEVVEETPVTPIDSNTNATSTSSSSSQEDEPVTLEVEPEDPIAEMSITQMTQELHENGINFADCLDAKSLRQRYRDYKDGRVKPPTPPKAEEPAGGNNKRYQQAPPRADEYSSPKSHYENPNFQQFARDYHNAHGGGTPNTTTQSVVPEEPGRQQQHVDPTKLVGELKESIAQQNGISPSMIDLYVGATLMEDHKHIYDYPGLARGENVSAVGKGQKPPGM